MSTEGPRKGELWFQDGNSTDVLNEAFVQDAKERERAYEESLLAMFNIYCGMHEQAEHAACNLVSALPHIVNNKYGNALLGYRILVRTNQTLADILQDDADFKASLIGDVKTNDGQDLDIWRDALRWDRRHRRDREEEIRRSALMDGLTDGEYSDIAMGGNADEIDARIAASQRDELERNALRAGVLFCLDETEVFGPAANPTYAPFDIRVPTLGGHPPEVVFHVSKNWLLRSIVSAASGSGKLGHFPRIAPIVGVASSELSETVTRGCVLKVLGEIRERCRLLTPPMDDPADVGMYLRSIDEEDAVSMTELYERIRKKLGEDMFWFYATLEKPKP